MNSLEQSPAPTDAASQQSLGDPALPGGLVRHRWKLIAGLLLLSGVVRGLMAWQLRYVCDDAYYYFTLADALQAGDWDWAFQYLNVNVYPAILAVVQSTGLDWVSAGKLWGVIASSLLVLPLYGWLSRQFSETTAVAACFAYAVNPELIELSVEPIREPTFWLLVTLFLYLTYRAVNELKWSLFVGMGIVLFLALHTRSEGWVLLVPLLLWSFSAWVRNVPPAANRRRLLYGTLLSVGMVPALLIVVNLTLLKSHSRWEWGRLPHFTPITQILSKADQAAAEGQFATATSEASTTAQTGEVDAVTNVLHKPTVETASVAEASIDGMETPPPRTFFKTFITEIEPISSLFLAIGVIAFPAILWRRGHLPLTISALLIFAAVWAYHQRTGLINGRYFLTMFFFVVPFVALGLIHTLNWWVDRGGRMKSLSIKPRVAAIVLLLGLLTVGLCDALSSAHRNRESQAGLGVWMAETLPDCDRVGANLAALRVAYEIRGTLPVIIRSFDEIPAQFAADRPNMLVLSAEFVGADQADRMAELAEKWKLTRVDSTKLPHPATKYLIYATRSFATRLQGARLIAARPSR